MKKALFFAMAAAMLFLTAISAAAQIPQASPGNFTMAAVVDSGQPGEYAVDETQSFNVHYLNLSLRRERSINGIVQFPIQPGDKILDLRPKNTYQFVDEFSFPYIITEEDYRNGKLIRVKAIPEEPDEPEEPDPPEPDDPDPSPDDPDDPDDPKEPDPGTAGQPAPTPPAGETPAFREDKPAWNTGGRVGMLKGSQPLNPGGILLGSLNKPARRSEAPTEMRQAAQAAALEIQAALSAQEPTGGDPVEIRIPLRNGDIMSPETAKDITGAVKEVLDGEAPPVTAIVEADTVTAGEVAARMYINLEKLEQNSEAIHVRVDNDTESTWNRTVRAHFERHFNNRVTTAAFEQQGPFGMEISIAMKMDLSGLDRDALFFYAFDAKENAYRRLNTGYLLDKHGYLHFNTEYGGSVIITDAPLRRAGIRPRGERSPEWGP